MNSTPRTTNEQQEHDGHEETPYRAFILFHRALTALAAAEETVYQLADAVEDGSGWDNSPLDWPGLKECFQGDLDGIAHNLSVGRSQLHSLSPHGGAAEHIPADLSDVPLRWRTRFDDTPGASAYLHLVQAGKAYVRAIDGALNAAPEEETEDRVDALCAARRIVVLLAADLDGTIPPIVNVVADLLDDSLPALSAEQDEDETDVSPDVTLSVV